MAAPEGNRNAAKAKVWSAAIDRALEKRGPSKMAALAALAEKLLQKCDAGDVVALKELGDRVEGKVAQSLEHTGNVGLFSILAALAGQHAEDSSSESDQCH